MNKNLRLLSAAAFAALAPLGVIAETVKPDPNSIMAYKTGDPADWPAELDAVIAAPDNHKILIENDKVRVLEVTLLPGVVEPLHSHRWPSVLYVMEAGDFIDKDMEGNVILDTRELPEPLPLPFASWKEPEAPHTVVNLSETVTIRLVRVEMKN